MTATSPHTAQLASLPPPPPDAFYPRPLIFLHIPKAAGTTLQEIVVRHYRGGRGHRFTGNIHEWREFVAQPREALDEYDVLIGHVHFGLHEYLSRPATYMTMLRDPVDRVVSHYHFVRTMPSHYLHTRLHTNGHTLHDYAVEHRTMELDNDQVRWLCARPHQEVPVGKVTREMVEEAKWNLANAFSVVGIQERFDESLACLGAAFGWTDIAPPPRKNVTRERPTLDQIPEDTLRDIREVNRFDIELYEFARCLFEKQLARLGVSGPVRSRPASAS